MPPDTSPGASPGGARSGRRSSRRSTLSTLGAVACTRWIISVLSSSSTQCESANTSSSSGRAASMSERSAESSRQPAIRASLRDVELPICLRTAASIILHIPPSPSIRAAAAPPAASSSMSARSVDGNVLYEAWRRMRAITRSRGEGWRASVGGADPAADPSIAPSTSIESCGWTGDEARSWHSMAPPSRATRCGCCGASGACAGTLGGGVMRSAACAALWRASSSDRRSSSRSWARQSGAAAGASGRYRSDRNCAGGSSSGVTLTMPLGG